MSRRSTAASRLLAGCAAICALTVPATASAADQIVPFDNYTVGGTLGLAKLRQSITLPPGATFNGAANLTTQRVTGDVAIPQFTTTLRVFGIRTQATLLLKQATPVSGTVKLNPDGSVTLDATTSSTLYLRRLSVLGLSVPTTCRTSAPVNLPLRYSGPFTTSFTFSGTTTVPRLTGCGPLGPTLSTLLSGPGNTYRLTLTPPAA